MILMSLMQALRPVSRLSATVFRMVTSCSARDDAIHVHFDIPRCISQELDVSSAMFARLTRRKEGCRYIVAKVRVQIVTGSEWSSASRDVSKHSDCLIINETAVVNAHPTQNINNKFTECSIGTDDDVPG